MTATTTAPSSAEREELVALLERHRGFFLHTVQGLTDEQARLTPTVSALSLGGLVKHVAATESGWLDFIEHGAAEGDAPDWDDPDEAAYQAFADGFTLLPEETLADVVAGYATVAARAVQLARTVDLDASHPLPEAPWFAKESWSNRRVLVHVIAETAQHAGHADLIRETVDGQRTMG
ncbi:DinB family protein [Microlunatus lacustris]